MAYYDPSSGGAPPAVNPYYAQSGTHVSAPPMNPAYAASGGSSEIAGAYAYPQLGRKDEGRGGDATGGPIHPAGSGRMESGPPPEELLETSISLEISQEDYPPGSAAAAAAGGDEKEDSVVGEAYEMGVGVTSMGELNFNLMLAGGDGLGLDGSGLADPGSPEGAGSWTKPSAQIDIPSFSGRDPDKFEASKICLALKKVIKKTFKKKSTVRKAILVAFGPCNHMQRMELRKTYRDTYKQDLLKIVHKYFSGPCRELLNAMMIPRPRYHAQWIELALKRNDIRFLTVLFCTMSPEDLKEAQAAYNKKNKVSLLKAIGKKTQNWFHTRTIKYFLTNVLETGRPSDSKKVDYKQVHRDAASLKEALSGKKLDKNTFVEIFSLRSFEHIGAVAIEFDGDLPSVIKESFKEASETGNACEMALFYASRRYELFGRLLIQSISKKMRGKNFDFLTYWVITRCETDLKSIFDFWETQKNQGSQKKKKKGREGILENAGGDLLQRWMDKEFKKKNTDYHGLMKKLTGFDRS